MFSGWVFSKKRSKKKGGNVFWVGIVLDFARLTTRTMHPHGAYVRGTKRNRIGSPHVRLMGRTCGGPGEFELAPIGVKLNGPGRVLCGLCAVGEGEDEPVADAPPHPQGTVLQHQRLLATKGGNFNVFGWVNFLIDFVRLTTRTEGPHGGASYVRGAKRNRIGRHRGGVERLGARTVSPLLAVAARSVHVRFSLRPWMPMVGRGVVGLPAAKGIYSAR